MDADASHVKRFLCSDLVALRVGERESFVNLEEIWRTGAVLESEDHIAGAEAACLVFRAREEAGESAPGQTVGIAIVGAERHQFGWRIEVRFLDMEWTPQLYTPAHLTDIEKIGAAAQKSRGAG